MEGIQQRKSLVSFPVREPASALEAPHSMRTGLVWWLHAPARGPILEVICRGRPCTPAREQA
jgi:hypothetical protein